MYCLSVTKCFRGHHSCKAARESVTEDSPLHLGQGEMFNRGEAGWKDVTFQAEEDTLWVKMLNSENPRQRQVNAGSDG